MTTTRKTAAKKTTTRKKATAPAVVEAPTEETSMATAEITEFDAPETAPTRKGPKPNPFARLEKARVKAEKARLAVAKVQSLVDAKDQAEAEEQDALQALADAVAAAGVTTAA